MSNKPVPEGFELIAGRSGENAKAAIAAAMERGFESASVRTVSEGYLVPVDPKAQKSSAAEAEEKSAAKKAPAKTKGE